MIKKRIVQRKVSHQMIVDFDMNIRFSYTLLQIEAEVLDFQNSYWSPNESQCAQTTNRKILGARLGSVQKFGDWDMHHLLFRSVFQEYWDSNNAW